MRRALVPLAALLAAGVVSLVGTGHVSAQSFRGEWQPNTAYVVGDVVTFQGPRYSCRQSHTSQVGWEPPNVPALWQAQ